MEALRYCFELSLAFLIWTLVIYCMHRLAHISHRWNPLWQLHRAHHRNPYLSQLPESKWPKFGQWFLWLGNWRASLDVIVSMTLPLLIIAYFAPHVGLPLLVFHYFYELFFSEYGLDHNPNIQGKATRFFAWGEFHLYHHLTPKKNFGLLITLWDRLLGTAVDPAPGTAWTKIRNVMKLRESGV
jgi:sterol desaturase/sphingolipid hydroxylase (fatty acid hydroxylase superfamily)